MIRNLFTQTIFDIIMRGSYGIEGIRYFNKLRDDPESGYTNPDDTYTFDITNGLNSKLQAAGYRQIFYLVNENVSEIDLGSSNKCGIDD